jgi:hypothetical protein
MNGLPKKEQVNCDWFLTELEGLPTDGPRGATADALLEKLPEAARAHAVKCADCEGALQDFAETRKLFVGVQEALPEAGPWFIRRVMQAIGAQEEEIEEKQNGFWISVRGLAPRLVAFAMVLLMLGGTWVFEVRRMERSKGPQLHPTEGIFESAPSVQVNDDVIAGTYEEPLP